MASVLDYKAKTAAAIAPSDTTATVFVDSKGKPCSVYVPSGVKRFRIRAGGVATGGTTTNFTPTIQTGSSTTATSNTDVAGLTARAYNSASGGWEVACDFQHDGTNSKLNGVKSGASGSTYTMETAAAITAISKTTTALAGLQFVVNGLFSAASSSNGATMDYFILEVIA